MRGRFGVRGKVSDRVNLKILRMFVHVEHMSGKQLTKRVCESNVEGRRGGRFCCYDRMWAMICIRQY